jgi:sugar/nucleoside kinase (ribokinase family)
MSSTTEDSMIPVVSCFSYLASVQTLQVERFPRINYGTDVISSDRFVAGDGPIVAGALCALGDPAVLGSNQVVQDATGLAVLARLRQWGVTLAPSAARAPRTRANVVIADRDGNRTWFSDLGGVADELASIDLAALLVPPIAYIDCYEVLGAAPRPLLTAALGADTDIVLNLGGSPPAPWLTTVTGKRRIDVVQTNADENDIAEAQRTLDALSALNIADLTIVTVGRRGALARPRNGTVLAAPSVTVDVQQVHGPGAVFSAAFIHARRRGETLPACLRFACAAGSLWCSRPSDAPLPSARDITTLLDMPSRDP